MTTIQSLLIVSSPETLVKGASKILEATVIYDLPDAATVTKIVPSYMLKATNGSIRTFSKIHKNGLTEVDTLVATDGTTTTRTTTFSITDLDTPLDNFATGTLDVTIHHKTGNTTSELQTDKGEELTLLLSQVKTANAITGGNLTIMPKININTLYSVQNRDSISLFKHNSGVSAGTASGNRSEKYEYTLVISNQNNNENEIIERLTTDALKNIFVTDIAGFPTDTPGSPDDLDMWASLGSEHDYDPGTDKYITLAPNTIVNDQTTMSLSIRHIGVYNIEAGKQDFEFASDSSDFLEAKPTKYPSEVKNIVITQGDYTNPLSDATRKLSITWTIPDGMAGVNFQYVMYVQEENTFLNYNPTTGFNTAVEWHDMTNTERNLLLNNSTKYELANNIVTKEIVANTGNTVTVGIFIQNLPVSPLDFQPDAFVAKLVSTQVVGSAHVQDVSQDTIVSTLAHTSLDYLVLDIPVFADANSYVTNGRTQFRQASDNGTPNGTLKFTNTLNADLTISSTLGNKYTISETNLARGEIVLVKYTYTSNDAANAKDIDTERNKQISVVIPNILPNISGCSVSAATPADNADLVFSFANIGAGVGNVHKEVVLKLYTTHRSGSLSGSVEQFAAEAEFGTVTMAMTGGSLGATFTKLDTSRSETLSLSGADLGSFNLTLGNQKYAYGDYWRMSLVSIETEVPHNVTSNALDMVAISQVGVAAQTSTTVCKWTTPNVTSVVTKTGANTGTLVVTFEAKSPSPINLYVVDRKFTGNAQGGGNEANPLFRNLNCTLNGAAATTVTINGIDLDANDKHSLVLIIVETGFNVSLNEANTKKSNFQVFPLSN